MLCVARYTLAVTVTDADGLTDIMTINVAISDVNEAPTITMPDPPLSVDENSIDGTPVGRAIAATYVGRWCHVGLS